MKHKKKVSITNIKLKKKSNMRKTVKTDLFQNHSFYLQQSFKSHLVDVLETLKTSFFRFLSVT